MQRCHLAKPDMASTPPRTASVLTKMAFPSNPSSYKSPPFVLPFPQACKSVIAKERKNPSKTPSFSSLPPPAEAIAMEMRKIACAALVLATAATTALAAEAPAPGPASASFAVTPAVGAAIAASFLSFFAFYLQ